MPGNSSMFAILSLLKIWIVLQALVILNALLLFGDLILANFHGVLVLWDLSYLVPLLEIGEQIGLHLLDI